MTTTSSRYKPKKFKDRVYSLVDPVFLEFKESIYRYLDDVLSKEHDKEIIKEIRDNLKVHYRYIPFDTVDEPEIWVSVDYQSSYDLLDKSENVSKTLEIFLSFDGSFDMFYDLMPPVYDIKIDLRDFKKVELLYTANQLFQYVESCDFEPLKNVVQLLKVQLESKQAKK